MCGIGKSIEAKRLVVPRDGVGIGNRGMIFRGFGSDKNVLRFRMVKVAQLCEYPKSHMSVSK